MKKKLVTLVLLVAMTLSLAGCAKSPCDLCGEEGRCKTYQNASLGEMDICSECADDLGLK